MGEWIKCNERMPEPEIFVLVYGPDIGLDMMKFYPVEEKSREYCFEWICGDERHDEVAYRDQITHWMPLPSPPEKEEDQ